MYIIEENDNTDKKKEVVEEKKSTITILLENTLTLADDAIKVVEAKNNYGSAYSYPMHKQVGYCSSTNNNNTPSSSVGLSKTIYFYDDGNLNNKARIWHDADIFFNWAREQGILIGTYIEGIIRSSSCSFCTRKKDSVTLIHRTTYKGLELALDDTYGEYGYYPRYSYYDEYWD